MNEDLGQAFIGTIEKPTFPRVGVAVIVLRGSEVLLGRSKKEPIVGKWVIPGGQIKPFEHIIETAAREFLEETGIMVDPKQVLFVSENIVSPEMVANKSDMSKADHRVVIYVGADYASGEATPGSDLSEVKWFDVRKLGNIQNETTEMTQEALYKFSLVLRARSGR